MKLKRADSGPPIPQDAWMPLPSTRNGNGPDHSGLALSALALPLPRQLSGIGQSVATDVRVSVPTCSRRRRMDAPPQNEAGFSMRHLRQKRQYGLVTYTAWVAVYACIAGLATLSLWAP